MSTNYPGALDNTSDLINNATDATVTATTHAQAHNNIADSIIAIETELGTTPKGTYASVAARLGDSLVKTPGAAQPIVPTADVVPLTTKMGSTLYVANQQEWRDGSNVVQAYVDKSFVLSAQGFKVAGTALSAAHLSNGVSGSGAVVLANSPALTGAPTAPTPSTGDNSTKIATTAFVLSNGVPTGAIVMYGGATAPSGWVLADGALYDGTQAAYSALWAIYGTTYGGTGQSSFAVPDLRGRIPVGKGTNADVTTLGASDGLSVGTRTMKHYHGVGSLAISVSAHSITDPGHIHNITDPGHGHNYSYRPDAANSAGTFNATGPGGLTTGTTTSSGTGISINSHTTGISIANHTASPSGNVGTTSGIAETPAYLVVNYIVKL